MQTLVPTFRELTREEIHALLGRNRVGRLAYAFHNNVDVETVPYVYDSSWVYGRITPGMKLASSAHHRFVAFEVDEVDSPVAWRSAVVRGAFYLLLSEGSAPDRRVYERARALLDEAFPTCGHDAETAVPYPLFRIPAYQASGRACEALSG